MTRVLIALVAAVVAGTPLASAQEKAQLSDVEQLRHRLLLTETALENALSQTASCRAQLRSIQLTSAEATLKTEIEKQHGGYLFDPKTGTLTKRAEGSSSKDAEGSEAEGAKRK